MKGYYALLLIGTVLITASNTFAQAPVNNDCSNATNLGSLPTPNSCAAGTNPGVGATITTSGTTVNATYPKDYVYEAQCIGGGNQAAPSPDVWYVFTLTGTVLDITLSATFANPNIALWTPAPVGSGCTNLQAVDCVIGNGAGTAIMSIPALAPGTVIYMQVSSNNKTATGTFNITINNNNDCSVCMTQASVTATPPPVNGSYQPGQTVQVCITISQYNEINNNWLHGLEYTFGPGWDLATLTTSPAADCPSKYLGLPVPGVWSWYTSVTSQANPDSTYGPGFFFEGPGGCTCGVSDNNPGDNFGDYTNGSCTWTFCITLQVANVCIPGQSLDIDARALGDGESGSWTSTACANDPHITFNAFTACCPPTTAKLNPSCAGNDGTATATPLGAESPWTYTWSNGTTQTALTGPSTITNLTGGAYTVTVTDGLGCTSTNTITLTTPTNPTPGINPDPVTICDGSNAQLTASGGASYAWSTTETTAAITVSPNIATTYSVTVTGADGCTATTAATVSVNPLPAAPIAGSNTPLCVGATLNLTATTVAGATYNWSGPNGFSSTAQNPSIANVVAADAGTYTVTSIASGCTSTPATVDVVINPIPAVPVTGSNTPLCVGNTLNLTASNVAGATYNWSGPNGFSSATQDPSIANVVAADAGTYTVTAIASGCTSTPGTTVVVINPIPAAPTAGSNTPLCVGNTLNLTATTVAGAMYSWSGPNGFSSVVQDPSITNVVAADAGAYTVTSIASGCTSTPATADVVINPIPAAPVAGSNTPLCVGATLNLTASNVAGAVYNWSGPNGFSSAIQDPSITNVVAADAGTYTVTSVVSGCTSTPATTVVVINPIPAAPIAGSNTPLCVGATLNLTASTVAGATYSWSGPNGFSDAAQDPSITNVVAADAGTYTVTSVVSGCTSTPATAVVVINPIPAAPVAGSNTPLCVGATLNLTATTIAGATYSWSGPNGFSSATQDPSITNVVTADAGTYTVTSILSGCTSTPATAVVVINPIPAAPIAGSNSPLCVGNTLNLTATTVAGATYSWSGPNGFSSATQDPSITNLVAADAGTYSVTSIVTGCTSGLATVAVVINPTPIATFANSNTPLCVGATLKLTATTVAGATYSWSGPNGFSSASQDPSITNVVAADAGSYTVTSIASGCTSTPSKAVVVINPIPAAPVAGSNTPVCVGGTLNLTATTVAGAIYSWSGPNGFSSTTQDPSITNVVAADAGTYTVTADVSGCTSTPATTDVIINPIPAAPIAGSNTPLCVGATLNLTASTVAGATYNWSGPNGFSSTSQDPSITNVVVANAGTYTVTSIESGCTSTPATAVVVIDLTSPPIAGSNTPVCVGATLNLTASTVAGATYSWSGPNGFSSVVQNPSFTNVVAADAGTYTVTAIASGCTSTPATATVVINALPVPIAGSNTPLCVGTTLNLTASTIAGASYSWSGPNGFSSSVQDPSIAAIVAADAGNYTVIVTDINSCQGDASTLVTVNPLPSASVVPPLSNICNGQTVNLTALGGTSYAWSNSATGANISVTPLATTTYTVTVTDANGCSATASAAVDINVFVIIDTTVKNVSCNGGSNGGVFPVAAGGQAPYTYVWGNSATTQAIQDVTAGTYTVTATDAVGCVGTVTATVTQPPALGINSDSTNINCNGNNNGAITITDNGGTQPYTYSWSDGSNTTATRTGLASGTYTVTVTDNNNCTISATVIITQPEPLAISSSMQNPTCITLNPDGSIAVNVTGGTTPYAYSWSNGESVTPIKDLTPGAYDLTVTDVNKCIAQDSFALEYLYNFSVAADPSLDTISLGDTTKLGYTLAGTTGNYSAVWGNPVDLSCTTCANPLADPDYTVIYTITITNDSGCTAVANDTVVVLKVYDLFVPNAFTPNGDGKNDFFSVYGNLNVIKSFEIKIFDRWGEIVYESSDPLFKWDGSYKGTTLLPGVLVYTVDVTYIDGYTPYPRKGSLTLIR